MVPSAETTTLAELLHAGRLRAEEAVAVVLATGDRLDWRGTAPAKESVLLLRSGEVQAEPPDTEGPEARSYAQLLHDLLPEPGAGEAYQVPGPLRLAVARGLGLIDLPPFDSAAIFGAHIRRFTSRPPREILAALVARRALVVPDVSPGPATQPWVERRGNAPRVDVLRGMLREADLQRFQLLETAARTWPPPSSRRRPSPVADLPLHPRPAVARPDLTLVHGNAVAPRAAAAVPSSPTSARRLAPRAATAALAVAVSFGGSYLVVRELHEGEGVVRDWTLRPVGRTAIVADPLAKREEGTPSSEPPLEAPAVLESSAPPAAEGTSGSTQPRTPAISRATAQRLPLSNGRAYSPSFAPEGGTVYFHSEHDGVSRLMRARLDPAGKVTRVSTLLDDGAKNYHPRVSPDGEWVAFDSDREGLRAVYVCRRDGSGVRRVSRPGYAAVPTWAPDARTLAIIRAEDGKPRVWNLWSVDLDSGTERRLTEHRSGQAWPGAWLSDGGLVYTHEDRIHLLDPRTGTRTSFASPRPGRMVRTAAVSPDGSRVAFQLYRDGMWVLHLEDGTMRRVLDDPTAEEFAWAPTGTHVAFHSRRAGQWGIWVAPAP